MVLMARTSRFPECLETENCQVIISYGLQGDSVGKNPPAMLEAQVRSPTQEDLLLEKEMTAHSSIFAWEIPWTAEPGGLHSPWGHKESGNSNKSRYPIGWMTQLHTYCRA